MPASRLVKWKICLIGEAGVGKTSLIRRFVMDQFDDRYMITLGTKVSKKEVAVMLPGHGPFQVDLAVWDIMGQQAFLELLKDAYFTGAHGILAVADMTRKATLGNLPIWIEGVEGVTGKLPMVLAANKSDLEGQASFGRAEVDAFAQTYGCDTVLTSARTGAGVEDAFHRLATIAAERVVQRAPVH